MKLSKHEIGLLAGALGVILAVAVYSLFFTPYRDKTDALKSELAQLQETERYYEELAANKSFYEEEIARMTEENDGLLSEFPADIKPETEIMYAVELEEEVDIQFSSLNYGTAAVLTTADAANGEEGAEQNVTDGMMQAYCVPMNMTYQSSYKGLKEAITYTNDHQNRMVIDTVSAAYDGTTGMVSGSMTLNMYYITGTDKVYEAPYVPNMQMGVSNIFGTIE